VTRIQHVTVTAASEDLFEPMTAFYLELGGWRLIRPPALEADTPGRWIAFGDTQLHLVLGPPANETAHFALELGDHYARVTKNLAKTGSGFRQARNLWGSPRSFVHDPAGNLVELFAEAPASLPG